MSKLGKQEILEVLALPEEAFWRDVAPLARRARQAAGADRLLATAMLGYSNVCRNQCLYCGMRAGHKIPRYRLEPGDVIAAGESAAAAGFRRIFLIAGEDPLYGFDKVAELTAGLSRAGLAVSLACGELEAEQYAALRAAGADEYVMKFEMSRRESFERLNPSTTFARRMAAIRAVQESGMALGSGNIVGWPGQTAEELAEDILLMAELNISWAPIIPYMPAQGTPLAAEGGPGDRLTNLKEIALIRLLLPGVKITAQQPGKDLKNGLADREGNYDAVQAGANVLFCDLLPAARARDFRVIDQRNVTGMAHLYRVAADTGLALDLKE